MGLLPFVAFGGIRQLVQFLVGWSNWLVCVPIAVVLGAFFASLADPLPHGFVDWPFVIRAWRRYLLFEVVEVGV